MTISIPRERTVDFTSPLDVASLRKCLCTILTHLVDLHVRGKQADAQFIGAGSAALHLHFDGVVESALEAFELIADRVRALDPHSGLNGRTPSDGCCRPSRSASPNPVNAVAAVNATAVLIIRRIAIARTVISAVHNRIRDDDPLTAALLCRIDLVLETQAMTLRSLSPEEFAVNHDPARGAARGESC
jgi:DNA-binding ferritin-like protein